MLYMVCGWLFYGHSAGVAAAAHQSNGFAGQLHRQGGEDVGTAGAQLQLGGAGLHDIRHIFVVIAQLCSLEVEGHGLALAGCKADAPERGQTQVRADDVSTREVVVELHGLVTGHAARVGDGAADFHAAIGGQLLVGFDAVYLEGGVVAESLDPLSRLQRVETEAAVINLKTQDITSDTQVKINGLNFNSSGLKLVGNLRQQVATLKEQVKTYYEINKQ